MRLQDLRTWRHVPTALVRGVVAHALRCQRYLSWHPTKLVVYAQATYAGDLIYVDRSTKQHVACHRGLRYEWDARVFEYQKVLLHTQPDGAVEAVVLRMYRVEVYALPSVNETSAPLWTWDVPFRTLSMCLCQDGRLLILGYNPADPDLTSRACTVNLLTCEMEHSWQLPWARMVVVRRAQDERLALMMVARDTPEVHYVTLDTVTGTVVEHGPRLQANLDSMWDVIQVGSNAVAMVEHEQISLVRWSDSRVLNVMEFDPLKFVYDKVCWLANSRELVLQRNGYFGVMVASP